MLRPWHRRLLRELAFVLIVGAPVLLFFLVARPRANASRLLKRLANVEVSRSHFQQVEKLAGQFSGFSTCSGDNCVFQFQNIWLHRLHLAPVTEFTVLARRSGLATDPGGGEVGALDLAMLVRSDSGAITSAMVFDRPLIDPGPRAATPGATPNASFDASITFDAQGRAGRTIVLLAPTASARQRLRARAFNLACLTSLGGCKTSRDLLPGIWQGARRLSPPLQGGYLPAAPPFKKGPTAAATLAARR